MSPWTPLFELGCRRRWRLPIAYSGCRTLTCLGVVMGWQRYNDDGPNTAQPRSY